MNTARILVVASCAILVSCATTERFYESIDQNIIDEHEAASAEIMAEATHKAQALPLEQQLFNIPRLGELPAGARQAFDLTLTPEYQADLVSLSAPSMAELDTLVERLRGRQNVRLRVTGFASATPLGADVAEQFGDNSGLSRARAQRVTDYLLEQLQLDGEQASVHGAGASEFVSSPKDPANRRVRIRGSFQEPGKAEEIADVRLPADFQPWWRPHVTKSMDANDNGGLVTTPDQLYLEALKHSSQIRVFSDIPLIRETAIMEAEGRFDPHAFAEARYNDVNEPVGSTLTTGGPNRFQESELRTEIGVRKKLTTGGEVELSQQLNTQDNNSIFFLPDDQGNSQLKLRFTQPLLNGGGLDYNRSTVAIAKLDSSIAYDEFQRQLESHLLEITRAYWTLYRERAILLQKRKLTEDTQALVAEIEARRDLDTMASEVATARAALARRSAERIRAELAVRNASSRIAALTNSPALMAVDTLELVPTFAPLVTHKHISIRETGERALQHRPEISQVVKQVKSAGIRADMSRNEILPILNLVFEARVNGLDDGFSVGGAFERQFDEGGPSGSVGLQLDIPLGNREAKARYRRRHIEARQLTNQLRTTVDTILLEVRVAAREVNTAYREIHSNYATMAAAEQEAATLRARFNANIDGGASTAAYLDNLLDAQERVGAAEESFVTALVVYNVALRNLDRSTGVLLSMEGIEYRRSVNDASGLPELSFDRE